MFDTTFTTHAGTIVRLPLLGHPDWMSSDGFDRLREWHAEAQCSTAANLGTDEGVRKLRFVAAILPAANAYDRAAQAAAMLGNHTVDAERVAGLLSGGTSGDVTERLAAAWTAYRGGMTATAAAAAAGANRPLFALMVAFFGAEQARADRDLETAIALVEDGARPVDIQAVLGCSSGHASKLRKRAQAVLDELNPPAQPWQPAPFALAA